MGILKSEMHQLLNGKDLEEESYTDLRTLISHATMEQIDKYEKSIGLVLYYLRTYFDNTKNKFEYASYRDRYLRTTNGSEKASVLTALWQKNIKVPLLNMLFWGKDTRFKE